MTHYTQAYVERMEAAIQRIRDMHRLRTLDERDKARQWLRHEYPVLFSELFESMLGEVLARCRSCGHVYPCPTIKALDGDQ